MERLLRTACFLATAISERDSKQALRQRASKFVASFLSGDASTVQNAFLLRKPANGPAPLVIVLSSVTAKVAALRAARARREAGQTDTRIAARLTRWQQQRRVALKPQLEQLKAAGTTVRFWQGHRLQRQEGRSWVDVPLQTNASQAAE